MKSITLTLAIALCMVFVGSDYAAGKPQGRRPTRCYTVGPSGPPTYDYDSIQDAIDACNDYDTVLVYDGGSSYTYTECIDFDGKDISVKEALNNSVTIDGNQTGSVVTFGQYESSFAMLEGFTITNGKGTYTSSAYRGAGIYIDILSDPTIKNCTITGNGDGATKCDYGGGVYIGGSQACFDNCTIIDNYADEGGGVYLNGSYCGPLFDGCIIQGNEADLSGGGVKSNSGGAELVDCHIHSNLAEAGAGLYIFAPGSINPIDIHDCDIYNNGDENTLDGGGIYLKGGAQHGGICFTIDSNEIYGNTADYGGGVYFDNISNYWTPSDFINNFIYENSATYGGGIYSYSLYTVNYEAYNNTSADNEATYGAGCCVAGNAEVTFTNCIFWDTEWGDAMLELGSGVIYATYCDIYQDSGTYSGTGNINEDPEFTTPGSDIYTISSDSPCKDTGINSGAPDHDFEDDDRPYNNICDMGADEYVE